MIGPDGEQNAGGMPEVFRARAKAMLWPESHEIPLREIPEQELMPHEIENWGRLLWTGAFMAADSDPDYTQAFMETARKNRLNGDPMDVIRYIKKTSGEQWRIGARLIDHYENRHDLEDLGFPRTGSKGRDYELERIEIPKRARLLVVSRGKEHEMEDERLMVLAEYFEDPGQSGTTDKIKIMRIGFRGSSDLKKELKLRYGPEQDGFNTHNTNIAAGLGRELLRKLYVPQKSSS